MSSDSYSCLIFSKTETAWQFLVKFPHYQISLLNVCSSQVVLCIYIYIYIYIYTQILVTLTCTLHRNVSAKLGKHKLTTSVVLILKREPSVYSDCNFAVQAHW